MPLGFAQVIGGGLGLLAFIGSKHYRSLFKQHYLSVATQNHLPVRMWSAACASGMLFSDSLWIWRNPKQALSRTEISNWEVVEKAINEGHGLVMLTPHLGGFEIIPRVLAQHFPATILYRPARQDWLNAVVEEGRAHPNMHFVPTNLQGVRQMTRALIRGEAIGILPDQVPSGGDGIWVPFFWAPRIHHHSACTACQSAPYPCRDVYCQTQRAWPRLVNASKPTGSIFRRSKHVLLRAK